MKFHYITFAVAAGFAAPLLAQTPQETMAMPSASTSRVLPAGTMVTMTPIREITSKKVKQGEQVEFQVINDVVENGVVVIPRGAKAFGTITMKTGRAVGGKSGKFEVTFDHVDIQGRKVPLMGQHRQEGRGNSTGALLGSMVISGRSAEMLPSQVVSAVTREPFTF